MWSIHSESLALIGSESEERPGRKSLTQGVSRSMPFATISIERGQPVSVTRSPMPNVRTSGAFIRLVNSKFPPGWPRALSRICPVRYAGTCHDAMTCCDRGSGILESRMPPIVALLSTARHRRCKRLLVSGSRACIDATPIYVRVMGVTVPGDPRGYVLRSL